MKETILNEVIKDLSSNYQEEDKEVMNDILEDVINDALNISNRNKSDENITILKSNIKKAVKTIYLQRGVEDVKSNSISGRNSTYDNAIDTMSNDIIKLGKRILP